MAPGGSAVAVNLPRATGQRTLMAPAPIAARVRRAVSTPALEHVPSKARLVPALSDEGGHELVVPPDGARDRHSDGRVELEPLLRRLVLVAAPRSQREHGGEDGCGHPSRNVLSVSR